jgi:hypothetical protein
MVGSIFPIIKVAENKTNFGERRRYPKLKWLRSEFMGFEVLITRRTSLASNSFVLSNLS